MLAKTKSKGIITKKGDHVTLNQLCSKGVKTDKYTSEELSLISKHCPKPMNRAKFPMLYTSSKKRVYTNDIPEQIYAYFRRNVSKRKSGDKDSGFYSKTAFPNWQRFADSIGTRAAILNEWFETFQKEKKHLDYVEAYLSAKELQEANLQEGAASGVYNGSFMTLVTKNITNWTEKQELKITGEVKHTLDRGYDLSKLSPTELQRLLDNPEEGLKLLGQSSSIYDEETQKLLETPEVEELTDEDYVIADIEEVEDEDEKDEEDIDFSV